MKVYCLSGLGADQRVFDRIDIKSEIIPIIWDKTDINESLSDYAKKLSKQIDTTEEFILLGVSFGGMIASEMNRFLSPKVTILISSAAVRGELPLWIRFLSHLHLNRHIPNFIYAVPTSFVIWNSRVKTPYGKSVIKSLMKDADHFFNKCCVEKLLNWQNIDLPQNLVRIHGTEDNLLPHPKSIYHAIENAGHFAIVENSIEISALVNKIIEKEMV